MHDGALHFVRAWACRGTVVELGSRNVNGSIRHLFGPVYWGIDIEPGEGVDEVADAATWQPPQPVDVVVCCEVLEHTPDAERIVKNALAMLNPGGLFLLTCAGPGRAPHSAHDGGPLRQGEYYANIDPAQLREWVGADAHIETHEDRGDLYAAVTV